MANVMIYRGTDYKVILKPIFDGTFLVTIEFDQNAPDQDKRKSEVRCVTATETMGFALTLSLNQEMYIGKINTFKDFIQYQLRYEEYGASISALIEELKKASIKSTGETAGLKKV